MKFGVRSQLYGIVGLVVLGFLALLFFSAHQETETLTSRRHVELKNLVESAISIANAQYQLVKAGKITEAAAKTNAAKSIGNLRYQGGNYFWINDLQPKMVMHPIKSELNGQDLSNFKDAHGDKIYVEFVKIARESGGGIVNYFWPKPGATKPIGKSSYVGLFKPWGWIIGTGQYNDDIEAQRNQFVMMAFAVGAAIALLIAGLAFVLAKNISRRVLRLSSLSETFDQLSRGNLALQLPDDRSSDEIGTIISAVRVLVSKLSTTISAIRLASSEVTNAAAEITTSTTDLSQRTEEQAASLEQTTAAMEEISAAVNLNATNAAEANKSAVHSRTMADQSGEVVAKAVDAMARIEESSHKIGDIIGVIDEIARQTNLLALNAAVEAARAGEAGRGFAVVASEVRNLAQRSSQAAKDIKDLILNSNDQVKDGVDLVNRAGTSLTEIVESIKSVATIVADIANASAEQATGIEEINRALTQMDEATQQNSALVEENAATAKTLEVQAKAMDERVSFFRLGETGATANASPAAAASARPAAKPKAASAPATPKQQPVAQLKHVGGGGPVRKMQDSLASAVKADENWKEF